MFDRNPFIVGKVGGVIVFDRFKIDFGRFDVHFGH
jgi:hypothetical protein